MALVSFLPLILEPSQRSNVGQKTSMINGVPFPARNKNGADKTVKIEAIMATLFLNQRLSKRISRTPRNRAIIMLGSLIE